MSSTLERSKLGERKQNFPRDHGSASSTRLIPTQVTQITFPNVVEENKRTNALQWVQLARDVRVRQANYHT